MLLQRGNLKLGDGFWQWSIPARTTCPGASGLCRTNCYAAAGRFLLPSVRDALQRNEAESRQAEFASVMSSEIRRRGVSRLRIHVSGDFYSAEYLGKWLEVVRGAPRVLFLAYTRSWRDPEQKPLLLELWKHSNVRLWLSCDRETGPPPPGLRQVRRAYMSTGDDTVSWKKDLVFRTDDRTPLKYDRQGTLVCPVEQGVPRKVRIDCTVCRLCWRDRPVPRS